MNGTSLDRSGCYHLKIQSPVRLPRPIARAIGIYHLRKSTAKRISESLLQKTDPPSKKTARVGTGTHRTPVVDARFSDHHAGIRAPSLQLHRTREGKIHGLPGDIGGACGLGPRFQACRSANRRSRALGRARYNATKFSPALIDPF